MAQLAKKVQRFDTDLLLVEVVRDLKQYPAALDALVALCDAGADARQVCYLLRMLKLETSEPTKYGRTTPRFLRRLGQQIDRIAQVIAAASNDPLYRQLVPQAQVAEYTFRELASAHASASAAPLADRKHRAAGIVDGVLNALLHHVRHSTRRPHYRELEVLLDAINAKTVDCKQWEKRHRGRVSVPTVGTAPHRDGAPQIERLKVSLAATVTKDRPAIAPQWSRRKASRHRTRSVQPGDS
jgi:hypothetical protein